jgi:hypothetical protein
MNLFGKKRRGISTVVETALLLSAVAILGSTMIMWSNSTLNSRETNLATISTSNSNKFNEFLSIEKIWFCHGGAVTEPCHASNSVYPTVNLTLTNVGTVGLNVTKIQLNNTVFSVSPPKSLGPAASYWWVPNPSWNSYHNNSAQTITVTTARGTIFTTQVTPP